jgi:pSer/pThr/pTyr-binding forkhead associated (FHA) protein
MKVCPSCGRENKDRAKFCTGCGASLASAPVVSAAGDAAGADAGAGDGGGNGGASDGAGAAGSAGSGSTAGAGRGADPQQSAFGPTIMPRGGADEPGLASGSAAVAGGGGSAPARAPTPLPRGPSGMVPRRGAPTPPGLDGATPVVRPLDSTLPAPMPAVGPRGVAAMAEDESSDMGRTMALDQPPPTPPPKASGSAPAPREDVASLRTMAVDPATLEPGRKPGAAGGAGGGGGAPVTATPQRMRTPAPQETRPPAAGAGSAEQEDAPARLISPQKGMGIKLRATPMEAGAGSTSTPTSPPPMPVASATPSGASPAVNLAVAGTAPGNSPLPPTTAASAAAAAAPTEFIDCPRCGFKVPVGFGFCGNCGHNVRDAGTAARIGLPKVKEAMAKLAAPAGLVLLTPDGRDMRRFELQPGDNVVGRTAGEVVLAENVFLSPRHAVMTRTAEGLRVRDLGSLNGVYRRIREETALAVGDLLCIGQQFFRFEAWTAPAPRPHTDGTVRHGAPIPTIGARLVVVGFGGEDLDTVLLRGEETVIGRANGDVIFASDSFISRSHAKVTARADGFAVTDLGSSNGTYLRIRGEIDVVDGDILLMGDQLFRVDLGA